MKGSERVEDVSRKLFLEKYKSNCEMSPPNSSLISSRLDGKGRECDGMERELYVVTFNVKT